MKVLVTEIEKEVLIKILPLFGLVSEIEILGETQIPEDDIKLSAIFDSIDSPYYIEENIKNLSKVLSVVCNAVEDARTPNWSVFCKFWELILNIQKQREIGYPVTDIEYVYKKGAMLNLPIELKPASVELGFYPDSDFLVIIGESEIGKMLLYQDCGDFSDFVFSVEYNQSNTKNSHWHPRFYHEALDDMVAFMTNNKEYFKNLGFHPK